MYAPTRQELGESEPHSVSDILPIVNIHRLIYLHRQLRSLINKSRSPAVNVAKYCSCSLYRGRSFRFPPAVIIFHIYLSFRV